MNTHFFSTLRLNRLIGNHPSEGRSKSAAHRLALHSFFMLLFCLPSAHAQVSASIKGTVTDQSGAPIPAATVTAKNTETGAARGAITDDAGRYQFVWLAVGQYEVAVAKPGFQEAIRSGICLVVGQEATVDLKLQVSAVQAEVRFTGAAQNNMQPGGTSGMLLGVDAVREFSVQRDSYGAEFGKRPGGQVLIVTQSGTNQLHGAVFEFLRNSALDAPNFFDQGSAPPFQRNQFGGSLGGPIR